MRLTDFWERLESVLGATYARSWSADVVVPDLGCTVDEALERGVPTIEVWRAVCALIEVPASLR